MTRHSQGIVDPLDFSSVLERQEQGGVTLTFTVSTDLEDLGETLDISFEEDEDYDTLGGFLTHMLGRIPKEGENPSVVYEGYRFTVLHVEERRVARVRIQRIPRPSSSSAEPAAGDEKRENGRDSQAKD